MECRGAILYARAILCAPTVCMLYAPIFLAQLFLKPRFKIDAVIMIICSIVIIINSVLTLQVSTAKPMIADLAK